MERKNLVELYENGDKYYLLIPLYNKWNNRTCFMSVGNTNVPEWFDLLNYCKENKIETAHFFLELIDVYEREHQEGTRKDNFVGFFNDIIYECFKNDENYPKIISGKGWVDGNFIQKLNVYYIMKYILKK